MAGIEPEMARRLARACGSGSPTEDVAFRVGISADECKIAIGEALEADGFVERSERVLHNESWVEWTLTVRGGALSMASFVKPITRSGAEADFSDERLRADAYRQR